MVIDTSALVAVLFDEPQRGELVRKIAGDELRHLERDAARVLDRRRVQAG